MTSNLIISEIMYNPSSSEDNWEWIELYNSGTSAADLTGYVVDDVNTLFHATANIAGGTIAPGGSGILYNADDVSAADFEAAWGTGINLIAVTNWDIMGLNNSGDTVALWDSFVNYDGDQAAFNNVIDIVVYDDDGTTWPADNGSASIYLTDLGADNNVGTNWALSTNGGTTPVGDGYTSTASGDNGGADVGSPGGTLSNNGGGNTNTSFLTQIGGFASTFGAEIGSFDPGTDRFFVVSGGTTLEVLDFSNPAIPIQFTTIDLSSFGDGVNSVSVKNGVVAVAVERINTDNPDNVVHDPGLVVFYNTDGVFQSSVAVGALPDALTFTPDGTKVIVANEGEPSEDYTIDPEGSISIIDISNGVGTPTVATADFSAYNDRKEELDAKGVSLFGQIFDTDGTTVLREATVAEDLEPEFVAVSPDGTQAFVTLQENNAFAVVDIESATVVDILPLGAKDHQDGQPSVTNFTVEGLGPIANADGIPLTTSSGQTIDLGGLSGLFYAGTENGQLKFYTIPDRGPNPNTFSQDVNEDGTNDTVRPFALPDYQARILEILVDEATGTATVGESIFLTQTDGTTPITGVSNFGFDTDGNQVDEFPVDADGNAIAFDPFGGDFEGIVVDSTDGSFWMVDEYRPAIYHFDANGVLINRFIPAGTAALAGEPEGTFGTETLPAVYANRRRNRGFEAVALDEANGILYAFIQTPLDNPDSSARHSDNIRILAIDTNTGNPIAEYVYFLENNRNFTTETGLNRADKIGDAVFDAETGKLFVIERDSAIAAEAKKFIFEIDLTGATNLLDPSFIDLSFEDGSTGGTTLEEMTVDELAALGVQGVDKIKVTNLPSIGYVAGDKPEGLAIVRDNPTDPLRLAVLNDNDFGLLDADDPDPTDGEVLLNPNPVDTVLGIIDFSGNQLDASNEDGIDGNLQNYDNLFGLYQPDAVASYAVGGVTYYVTANEGDARLRPANDGTPFGDEGDIFEGEARIRDLTLDPTVFPDAATLQDDALLGRLKAQPFEGDLDGDGDFDQLFAFGGRSFSIWDQYGNQVFDSGDDFARIIATDFPDLFVDSRSDDKGSEPEAVTVGEINDRYYAFVGLERAGGVFVYDVTNPTESEFIEYIPSSDGTGSFPLSERPEDLTFVSAEDSPNDTPLLIVTNEDTNTVDVFSITTPVRIADIQGEGHTSPLEGQTVTDVPGIVTAVDSNGFYIQDATPDANDATSDAIFVFTSSAPTVVVGDSVLVSGTVSEFQPGDPEDRNLTETQIGSPTVTVVSSGNDLPDATIIGSGGRIPPTENIDDDGFTTFDPATSGIDFFESLEGMRVTATNLTAVAGTNRFGEIFAITGDNATGLSERGTLNISEDDFNPEKIQIDEDSGIFDFDFPTVNVGDFLGDVTGVIDYSFGNYEILVTEDFTSNIVSAGLTPETTDVTLGSTKLTVASYNVLNLETNDADGDEDVANGRFDAIAAQIINNLGSPDIIGLQEIQDNSGSTDDGTTSAADTLQALVDAIVAAGGPTYSFIDNTFITDGASGGQPGGNIRTAFLYNDSRVDLVDGSVETISNQDPGGAFENARLPLVATFTFNGEDVTVVNNHFSSKGGSSAILGLDQPFEELQEDLKAADFLASADGSNLDTADTYVNGSLNERRIQAQAVNDYVDGILANNANTNVVVLGDLNEFEFVSPLGILAGTQTTTDGTDLSDSGEAAILTNLTENVPDEERYSFIFQGNSQLLDHILVSDSLVEGADVDIVNVNTEFAETDARASDHDPVVARLDVGNANFTLQLLHVADQEATTPNSNITNLSAILNALENEDVNGDGLPDYPDTLRLSSGDAIIPGLFFEASEAVFGSRGIGDLQIQNELGFEAIALGNHEFDFGTEVLAGLIDGSAPGSFSGDEFIGTDLEGLDFAGTAFPYLSTNLDFSTDDNLAPLEVDGGGAPQANTVTSSVIIDVNGEDIGVVGATTPTLASISSPDGVTITPSPFGSNPTDAELDALAAEIQLEVDALLANNPGLNKIVLLAHMQQIEIELALAERLENVDIIVAGGSNTRLFDDNDRIRDGDSDQGQYPQFITNAGGTQTAVVNTDGSYKYVGRLVLEFDDAGNIIPDSYDPDVSGAYATDDQGVADLNAQNLVDPEVQAIVDAIEAQIVLTESNVLGISDVFLNGNRSGAFTSDDPDGVRTQETNLGNLTADANLAEARKTDATVVVSLKNGGGIRDSIGEIIVPPGGTEAERIANSELVDSDGNVIKPEGGVSQTDVESVLAFNNDLVLMTLTKEELVGLLEHGVSALPSVSGRFPQVAGVKFSFDQDEPEGSQIQNAGIFDEEDNLIAELVRDGELVGDPAEEFRIVTLGFLAQPNFDNDGNFIGGGDGYPFPNLNTDPNEGEVGDPAVIERVNFVELAQEGVQTGAATFADDGTEQDALAEYLLDNFSTTDTAFDEADVGPAGDERIQNLDFREDTIFSDDGDGDDGGDGDGGDSGDGGDPGIDPDASDEEEGIVALLGALALTFSIETFDTSFVNELFVFRTQDAQGTVQGTSSNGSTTLNPGDAGYLEAILGNANTEVVLSTLDSGDDLPDAFEGQLSGLEGELLIEEIGEVFLGFGLVVDGTLDELGDGLDETVFLSTLDGAIFPGDFESGLTNFSIAFGDDGGFDDLIFNVQASEFNNSVDTSNEFRDLARSVRLTGGDGRTTFAESIDLRLLSTGDTDSNNGRTSIAVGGLELTAGQVIDLSITLYREAAFDNLIGFYVVDNTGAITDGSGNLITPIAANRTAYAQAAFDNAIARFEAPGNQTTGAVTLSGLEVGNLIVPFIISNSTSPNDDFSNIYFPFLALNADGADHIRLLGNGIFGFEDLPGGGDQDFDDVIAQITSVSLG